MRNSTSISSEVVNKDGIIIPKPKTDDQVVRFLLPGERNVGSKTARVALFE